ncbi:MAG: ClbS/DfsB family four-helix bundle protein, partial [Paracoccus sp. (in: a-proteobacteria)]|nr:ClbS/DfsB family four-helix bundle protein [Paracoccus sp. (in: a-proteobacteria)]
AALPLSYTRDAPLVMAGAPGRKHASMAQTGKKGKAMAVPASKADLLTAVDTNFARLIADLVAYLIGWNTLVLTWLDHDDRGQAVDFPETGFSWSDPGRLAEKFYADYQDLEWGELLDMLRDVQLRLRAQLALRSKGELYGRAWYGTYSKGRMIQLNSASPYANARARLRKWLRETG